jgi:hypothetical protein
METIMLKKFASSLLAAALLVAVGACEADREGAQQMDPAPNPAIEAAPAMPTPPVGVPMPGTPEAAEQARQEGDTLRQDTLRRDTVPRRVP